MWQSVRGVVPVPAIYGAGIVLVDCRIHTGTIGILGTIGTIEGSLLYVSTGHTHGFVHNPLIAAKVILLRR